MQAEGQASAGFREQKMDSQGRKVVVCDNGTGVSVRTCGTVKSHRVSLPVLRSLFVF